MAITLGDIGNMDDDALDAYLLGLVVNCPTDTAKDECRLLELQSKSPSEAYDMLQSLDRLSKLRLAARHHGCIEWKQAIQDAKQRSEHHRLQRTG